MERGVLLDKDMPLSIELHTHTHINIAHHASELRGANYNYLSHSKDVVQATHHFSPGAEK